MTRSHPHTSIIARWIAAIILLGTTLALTGAAGSAPARPNDLNPDPCAADLLANGGFELGTLSGWETGGLTGHPLAHVEVTAPGRYSSRSAFLGNGYGERSALGTVWLAQRAWVPANATGLVLAFWHRVDAPNPGSGDAFWVSVESGGERRIVLKTAVTAPWTPLQVDLSEFIGRSIRISFHVTQDGQPSTLGVYLDDITLCAAGPESGGWEPPEPPPDACPGLGSLSFPDYCPEGMPDLSQRLPAWRHDDRWTHDAAVAAANALWWLDSAHEASASPPPAAVDHYRLVETGNQLWDDHDLRNAEPLVEDLAGFIGVGPDGASPSQLAGGLTTYIASKGLDDKLAVQERLNPSADWIRDAMERGHAVVLAIGLRELRPEGEAYLGSHYATAAEIACDARWLAISDPWLDHAEAGYPGHVRPWTDHGHPTGSPDNAHHDVGIVSHDRYALSTLGARLQLATYPASPMLVEAFAGMNAPAGQAVLSPSGRLPVLAIVERAISIGPRAAEPEIRIWPAAQRAREGDVICLSLNIDPAGSYANGAGAYLGYDPRALLAVDRQGIPVSQVEMGDELEFVDLNQVRQTQGEIDIEARMAQPTGDPFALGTLCFRALQANDAAGTPLSFSWRSPRKTGLYLNGTRLDASGHAAHITISRGAKLVSDVELQGFPGEPPAPPGPMLLSLYPMGETLPALVRMGTLDAIGRVTVGAIPPGSYDVALAGPRSATHRRNGVGLSGSSSALTWGPLAMGDLNGDNVIDILDASLLGVSWGAGLEDEGYDAQADLNLDGVIDVDDANLLSASFWLAGDIGEPALTPGNPPWPPTNSIIEGVGLSLSPSQVDRGQGGTFLLYLVAEAGDQMVDGVEAQIEYDPSKLVIVDGWGDPATAIEPGGALVHVIANTVSPLEGRARFAAAALGTEPPNLTFTVARVRFRILPTATGDAWIRLGTGSTQGCMAARGGEALLGGLGACHISIASPPTPTPSPSPEPTATLPPTGPWLPLVLR